MNKEIKNTAGSIDDEIGLLAMWSFIFSLGL